MKFLNFVLIILMAVSLVVVSCSEDDESPTEPTGSTDPNVICETERCIDTADAKDQCGA